MVLKAQPRTLLLNTNSSMISGLSALIFDVLLLAVINAAVQSLCSIVNLHLVYDKQKPISPTTTRLGLLWESPVGGIRLVRWLSVLIALSTTCVFILGFAITGKTVPRYERVAYRSLVQITYTPAEIDYDQEFKKIIRPGRETRVLVSRRLLAMSYPYYCIRNNYTHFNIYGHAYRDSFLDTALVDMMRPLEGAVCVTEENFSEARHVRSHPVEALFRTVDCDIESIPLVPSSERKLRSVQVSTNSCGMNISRLQCYGDVQVSCATIGLGTIGDKSILFAFKIQDYTNPAVYVSLPLANGERLTDTTTYDHIAANIAFLEWAGFVGSVNHLGLMALSNVTHNVELERRVQDVQATEIDLRVSVPAILFVLAVVLSLFLTVSILWVRVVFVKGRRGYNTFTTVPGVLELLDSESASKMRRRFGKWPMVGVRKDSPIVGEGSSKEVSGADWEESEIR